MNSLHSPRVPSRRLRLGLSALLLSLPLSLAACSGSATPRAEEPATALQPTSLAPALCSDLQDMFVVAHPDDDLLFMNPNLASSLRAGHCIFTVYLTTGANPGGVAGYNATYGTSITPAQYAAKREAGILAAYAQNPDDLPRAVALGAAAQALKHTLPGDLLAATRAEIEAATEESSGGTLQR